MPTTRLDITDSLEWVEDLPRPQWDVIQTWVERNVPPDERPDVWNDILNQWLDQLAEALPGPYCVDSAERFALLSPQNDPPLTSLLPCAARCQRTLAATLTGVADDHVFGPRLPILVLADTETYYQYVAAFHSEGKYGGSSGMQIRQGYAHIAMWGTRFDLLENTLAHEMTHLSLRHLNLPQWVEEGLAQMFEHDMTGRQLLILDQETARKHKSYWRKHGLDAFWRGHGFQSAGRVQELSYQLAEVLVRLLIEAHRPRWFGMVRRNREKLLAFLREADASDCGESSATKNLGKSLGELAGRFLGAGEWSPITEGFRETPSA